MNAHTGRMIDENGNVINILDYIDDKVDTGKTAKIEGYAPASGNFIGEDGKVYNIVKAIMKGAGGGVSQPLTINIGAETFKYTGAEAVTITIEEAEGVTF